MATIRRPVNENRQVTTPSAKMRAAWTICDFANGSCHCWLNQERPCDSILSVANSVIRAAKEELAEKYVLRKRPQPQHRSK